VGNQSAIFTSIFDNNLILFECFIEELSSLNHLLYSLTLFYNCLIINERLRSDSDWLNILKILFKIVQKAHKHTEEQLKTEQDEEKRKNKEYLIN